MMATRDGMLDLLARAGADWAEGRALGEAVAMERGPVPSEVAMAGMGGSAIAGDLAAATLLGRPGAPARVRVCREYAFTPPPAADALVVLSSYSGDTEETLAVMDALPSVPPARLAIASGGALATRASSAGWPLLRLPGGRPPRAALYLTWAGLLAALARAGAAPSLDGEMDEAATVAAESAAAFGPDTPEAGHEGRALARHLAGGFPLLVATSALTAAVATRWKGQLGENAKTASATTQLPEMHHNEIVPLARGAGRLDVRAVLLRDAEEHPRVAARADLTRSLFAEADLPLMEARGRGHSRLARLVSLALLGDFASVYLALDHDVEPTPVDVLDRIKKTLRKLPDGRS